ncbi:hypothetical protein [Motilimonas eburnea]|nr:hypothetical protein [Motilimonas eburnea]
MAKLALVRVIFGVTTILGFQVSALYFFLALIIYCTHHREVFGW